MSAVVTRGSEQAKYERCYAVPNYHCQGARLKRVSLDIDSIPYSYRYLDVGCGRAEMVHRARMRGIKATGLELVPSLCGLFEIEPDISYEVVNGVVTEIPFDDDAFDAVSCYDMLEHLPEEQVDDALSELFRVAKSVLFLTTNDRQSRLPLDDGGFLELHLTRKPRPWWDDKIDALAKPLNADVTRSVYGRDEWHWRIAF